MCLHVLIMSAHGLAKKDLFGMRYGLLLLLSRCFPFLLFSHWPLQFLVLPIYFPLWLDRTILFLPPSLLPPFFPPSLSSSLPPHSSLPFSLIPNSSDPYVKLTLRRGPKAVVETQQTKTKKRVSITLGNYCHWRDYLHISRVSPT